MNINAYLFFDGRCAEAFALYERVLGGKIVMMVTHKDAPPSEMITPDWEDKIMHARLVAGDAVLMGSDAPPAFFHTPQGFSVSVLVDTPAEADRIFAALSENGTVRMPISETFWALRFGMLTDPFGIPWMINCERAGA